MAEEHSPDWYWQAASDVAAGRYDTPAAQAIVAETREMIFKGEAGISERLSIRGAKRHAVAVLIHASKLESSAAFAAANTDLDAGQTATPHVDKARQVAKMMMWGLSPPRATLVAKLKERGASDALAELIADDPEVLKTATSNNTQWSIVGFSLIALGAMFLFGAMASGEQFPIWAVLFFVVGLPCAVIGMTSRKGRA